MLGITWDKITERYYEHGLDRGVLYMPGKDPIPWNGLMSFDESSTGTTTVLYRDGVVYLADADAGDFSGKLTALFYPSQFGEMIGIPKATDGLYVDGQKPKRFGFSYRTLIGSGTKGDQFGYQIHLVYNAMATLGAKSRKSIGASVDPSLMNFDIVCTPVKMTGRRPTAHYIIDTRGMSADKVTELEEMIYGDGVTPGALPDPDDLFNLMNYGPEMTFTVYPNGTFTVEGSSDNLIDNEDNSFTMLNINAADNLDGTYDVSDGGDTTVTIVP